VSSPAIATLLRKGAEGDGSNQYVRKGGARPEVGGSDPKSIARALGVTFNGVQAVPAHLKMEPLMMFTDPAHGSTLAIPASKARSYADVAAAVAKKRAAFGLREVRAVLVGEAKDAGGHGSEKRAALPVGKKDPAEMSGAEINKELDRHDARSSELTRELIDAGHGSVRFNDLPATGHPAGREMHDLSARTGRLRSEIARRYGPGAPSRLPKGFGPIREANAVRATLAVAGR
jgi:hypothetical protein